MQAAVDAGGTAAPSSMNITLKLFATLTDYLPPDARRANQVALELPEGTTVLQAFSPFSLPEKMVHLVLVNGHYIAPERRATQVLQADDVLAIWPPIAGG
jgi:sulfur carrier protein ThiS